MREVGGLPLFLDEVPTYEARGEIMLVKWEHLTIAIPIGVVRKCVLACSDEIARWQVDQLGRVVPMSRPRAH